MILSIALFVLCLLPNTAGAQDSAQSYLQRLIERAKAMALHEQRYWHLLLHYRSSLTGGFESEADEPGFFLAPDGKTDPEAELQATLTQFFATDLVGRSQPAGAMRFHRPLSLAEGSSGHRREPSAAAALRTLSILACRAESRLNHGHLSLRLYEQPLFDVRPPALAG